MVNWPSADTWENKDPRLQDISAVYIQKLLTPVAEAESECPAMSGTPMPSSAYDQLMCMK